jgi:serine O-acetyltransferase
LSSNITISVIIQDLKHLYSLYAKELLDKGISLPETTYEYLAELIYTDLRARIDQDPTALSEQMIYMVAKSFRVIMYHRLAHYLFTYKTEEFKESYQTCGYRISEVAAVESTIEIHPEATIGKGFVIDHGINTLIGATSQIGDYCTLLQNVVLGSRKITFNDTGKRHPTLGNGVHVAGGVRILGPVHIGDHVFIGPDCLISEDVPAGSRVKLIRTQQVVTISDLRSAK